MFDNIALLTPDDQLLARVSKDRVKWYVERDLADQVDETTVRLKFEPRSRKVYYEYELEPRPNKCVVCGTKNKPSRHHVVPYRFRKYLPAEYKNRNIFDLLIVCRDCHDTYHIIADKFIVELFEKHGVVDQRKEIELIRNPAKGLANFWDRIPEARRQNMIERVSNYTGIQVTFANIEEVIDLLNRQFTACNPDQNLVECFDIKDFVIMWRLHFIDTMKPKHLSQTWYQEMGKVMPREIKKSKIRTSKN